MISDPFFNLEQFSGTASEPQCEWRTGSMPDPIGHMRRGTVRGFTFVEVVFSLSLLSIAVLGLAMTIPFAAQSNNRNRVDAEGALLVQQELEQILAQPLSSTSVTDSGGNSISIGAGGCALLSNGTIDYTQAAASGYSATLTGTSKARYELRWNVQSLSDGSKQFTIAANRVGGLRFLLPPVNVVGRRGTL